MSEFGKWIPVTERLPEGHGEYLTTTGKYRDVLIYNPESNHFRTNSGILVFGVIAWMELPPKYDPPKPKELPDYLVPFLDEKWLWQFIEILKIKPWIYMPRSFVRVRFQHRDLRTHDVKHEVVMELDSDDFKLFKERKGSRE